MGIRHLTKENVHRLSFMTASIGIDLGTTYSAAAQVDAEGKPVIISNAEGERTTPSVVWFGADPPVVGRIAKDEQKSGASEVASFFKRSMGDPNYILHFGGRDYSPVDLSTLVLKKVKADCEKALGKAVARAVITVPAYFNNLQREATIEAGRKAGLDVRRIINEPTAAVLAYGVQQTDREEKCLVYDLGGGTFDVTLAQITPAEIVVLATDGDHQLGGKDWDDRVARFLAGEFESEHGFDPLETNAAYQDLLVRCELAKQQLSKRETVRVKLDFAGRHGSYELSRARFEDLTADLMERSVRLTEQVLLEQGLKWSEISSVLLVGGSTRMPMVNSWVERMTGRPVRAGINVDEAVALGAAIQMATDDAKSGGTRRALAGTRKVQDVMSHSLGVVSESKDRLQYVNTKIIEKNGVIPTEQTRPFRLRTRARGANQLEVYLTQGESENPTKCAILGKYTFSDITHVGGTDRAVIDVRYQYDQNGVVTVSAIERSTGRILPMTVDTVPEDMSWLALPPVEEKSATSVTCYLAFDLSGSMAGEPLREAQRAGLEFVQKMDLTSSSVGLIAFADLNETRVHACQDAAKINRGIRNLEVGSVGIGNGTNPFEHALKLMRGGEDPRYLIVLADGVWYAQEAAELQARECHRHGIEIISIGFGEADRKFLERIATTSMGSIYTNLSGLSNAFSKIAEALTEGSVSSKGLRRAR